MAKYSVEPVDQEVFFDKDEIIVSKTDLKGRIIYANDIFCRVAELSTRETIGEPHSLIRHPDMPRAVFKLLWETIESGSEIFAYVKNMSKSGKYYWVFAHVTPSFDASGHIDGYHSNRRYADPAAVRKIDAIYKQLLAEEKKHANAKDGMAAGYALLHSMIEAEGKDYSEFVWSLAENADV